MSVYANSVLPVKILQSERRSCAKSVTLEKLQKRQRSLKVLNLARQIFVVDLLQMKKVEWHTVVI